MSFRVLVIPEDPTYNGYILGPLAEALLTEAGHPNSRVDVLAKAGTRGFPAACEYIRGHLDDWPFIDLFLFMPDRDGKSGVAGGENRAEQLAALETHARAGGKWLLGCAAIEEVEVWLMGGHPEKLKELGIGWTGLRQEPKPSVGSFPRFLEKFGDQSVGEGRKKLMREACRSIRGLLDRCDELKVLAERIRAGEKRLGAV